MKKSIIALTLITGLVVATAASANWGRGGGFAGSCPQGYMAPQGRFYQQEMDPASQEKVTQFYNDTQELRKQLVMKRAERRALLQAETPDPAAVAKLAGEIFDLQNVMQEKAAAAGVDQLAGCGGQGGCNQGMGPWGGGPRGGGRMMGGPRF